MTDDRNELIDEVGIELDELRRAADRLDEAVATQFGLNRTDLRCIGILYRRGRVTAGELAEESGLTPGAITTVLDRMERNGFANRVADPSDRRRVIVTSTAPTRELGARVRRGRADRPRSARRGRAAGVAVIRDYLRGSARSSSCRRDHRLSPGGRGKRPGREAGRAAHGAARRRASGRLEFIRGPPGSRSASTRG